MYKEEEFNFYTQQTEEGNIPKKINTQIYSHTL